MKKYILFILLIGLTGFVQHPLKLSTTKVSLINHKLNMEIKIFADDLSQGMQQYIKKPISYETEVISNTAKIHLKKYLLENIIIKINNNPVKVDCIDIKTDHSNTDYPVVYAVLLSNNDVQIKSGTIIKFQNTILFQYCPEQKNIINCLKLDGIDDKTLVFANENKDRFLEIKY